MLRVPATLITLILLFPVLVLPLTSAALPKSTLNNMWGGKSLDAIELKEFEALDKIAPAVVFAPLDISPEILLRTRNAIIGTGHHRNLQGMKLVIHAFVSPPGQARSIVTNSTATFLLTAPTAEMLRYQRAGPDGLASRLLEGKVPEWLSPVALPGLKYLRLYRIAKPEGPSGSAAPDPAS